MENHENTLRLWTAPQLLRLNQVDGTEKHLVATEQGGPCNIALDGNVSGGVPHTSGACGPS